MPINIKLGLINLIRIKIKFQIENYFSKRKNSKDLSSTYSKKKYENTTYLVDLQILIKFARDVSLGDQTMLKI